MMANPFSKARALIEYHPRLEQTLDHLIDLIESSQEPRPLDTNIGNVVLQIFGSALTEAVRNQRRGGVDEG